MTSMARAQANFTDDQIDSVMFALTTTYETPSRIARKAKVETWAADEILRALVDEQMAKAKGNGSWTRFAAWQ